MSTHVISPATFEEHRPAFQKVAPPSGWFNLNFRELWTYRELLYFFIWRDLKVRYKQTLIGALWVIVQPLLTMIAFTIFFGRLAHIPSDKLPYPIFYYSALLPWMYFAGALQNATNSMIDNQRVITKVYFPRILLPMAAVGSGLVDFAIGFLVLVGMLLYYRITPVSGIVLFPVFLLLAVLTALGVGIWLSALNAIYRDVRYLVPFLIQFWMLASPVAYSSTLVPGRWRSLYGLNPMAGVIESFRWSLTGHGQAPNVLLAGSVVMVLLVLVIGIAYFQKVESTIADVV